MKKLAVKAVVKDPRAGSYRHLPFSRRVPGNPEASLLFKRISVPMSDADHMPPEGEPQMTADEIAAVRAWIESGARSAGNAASAGPEVGSGDPTPPGVSHARVQARAGGCGACGVGSQGPAPLGALAAFALPLLLLGRRIRRQSL